MADLKQLAEAIINGNAPQAKELTQQALDAKTPVKQIVNDGLIAGMAVVGDRFKKNEFYVPEVLIAARAMHASLDLLRPLIAESGLEPVGRVAIGSGSLALAAVCLALTATLPGAHKLGIGICVTLGLGIMDCMLPCAWAICLDVGEKYAGTVSGAMNSAGCLGGFLCAALFGWVVKETGNYNLPVLGIAVMVAISALLFACINPNRRLVPNENDPSPGFNDH
jgi:MFS family permease